jgi:thioester reductase-like protein
MSFAAFQPHVRGVANLASFALRSTYNAQICFLSSVATVQKWSHRHPKDAMVPEQSLNDAQLTMTGYGLSKLAATMVLERAAERGVRTIVLRVGQMAGPIRRGSRGSWTKHEYLPSIIASSKYLGMLPDSLGPADHVDWIPVDLAADLIWEMANSVAANDDSNTYSSNYDNSDSTTSPTSTRRRAKYLHLTNPQTTTWQQSVLPTLQQHFGQSVRTVPLKDWIDTLKASTNHCIDSPVDAEKNPAIKLTPTYESFLSEQQAGRTFPHLSTEQSQAASAGMQQLRSVNADWLKIWLEQWAF